MTTSQFCPVSRDLGRRPEELLPAIPYLLGYQPADSLVCLFFDQHDQMRLSSRVDWDTCLAAPDDVADVLAQRGFNCDAVSVLVAAVDVVQRDDRTLQALSAHFATAGLTVGWVGECAGTTWRGLDCSDTCGVHLLDPHCVTVVGLIADGNAPAPDRQTVVAEVAPAANPLPDLRLANRPAGGGPPLELWRDETIEDCMELLRAHRLPTDRDVAVLAAACCDTRARDVVLWRLTVGQDTVSVMSGRTWEVLSTTLQRAPAEAVAPVAAVAGLVAWQMGEGTRAMACLNRAYDADPTHSLASLVFRCVDAAQPPSVWWQVMASLDESTCRHGSSAEYVDAAAGLGDAAETPPGPFDPYD